MIGPGLGKHVSLPSSLHALVRGTRSTAVDTTGTACAVHEQLTHIPDISHVKLDLKARVYHVGAGLPVVCAR